MSGTFGAILLYNTDNTTIHGRTGGCISGGGAAGGGGGGGGGGAECTREVVLCETAN